MLQILLAFAGGLLTVAAPCILPVLPILLGSSVGNTNKLRPIFIVLGFITSFALASILISILVLYIPFFSHDNIRTFAIILIAIFGIFLLWPKPFEMVMGTLSPLMNRVAGVQSHDNTGALLLGMTLGIVWAPCAGPILAAILALIAISGNSLHSVFLLIAYALGAGIPMLIIAYLGQWATTKIRSLARYSGILQKIFGVLIILLAIAMFKQYDTILENKLTAFFPQSHIETKLAGTKNTDTPAPGIEFSNYGKAPEFTDINHWLNSDPLAINQLKGKVVLVDFWTYTCINCIRTLPYVTKWYDTYKNNGLVVVGVHTPEFAFEKETGNVETAIKNFNIHYPVAQDNSYGTWQAFNNQYWPAEYLIDKNGTIVYEHFGEGNYDHTENAIRQLLGLDVNINASTTSLGNIGSPEMYFGTDREQYLTGDQKPFAYPTDYIFRDPDLLALNTFALEGNWQFYADHAALQKPNGQIRLHFSSGKVFVVAASDKPITIKVTVDGKPQPDVTVQASKLYQLFDSSDYSEHILEIKIPEAGFNAFTFTFG